MSKIPEETKLAIMGKLHAGVAPRALVEEFKVPYPTVLKFKHELKDATAQGQLHTLINVDEIIVESVAHQVAEELTALSPEEAKEIKAAVGEVTEGAKGLNVLNTSLQTTALKVAGKLNEKVDERNLELKELNLVVDSLTKLQTAFFNKGTQVNIQNNVGEQTTRFKAMMKQ